MSRSALKRLAALGLEPPAADPLASPHSPGIARDPALAFPQYGNSSTFNMETVLKQNILNADFYRNDCARLTTWQDLIDQIYYQVDYVEPWLAGNARGPSTAFCLLFRLCVVKPSTDEVRATIDHEDSAYIRAVGFLFLRYVADPRTLWDWMGPYCDDPEELQPSGPNGSTVTMGDFVRDLLLEQYYFETIFPRIPKKVDDDIRAALAARGLPDKGKGNGGQGGPDRRGGDDGGNKRPASVKASLSVALGQRAPNRAGTTKDLGLLDDKRPSSSSRPRDERGGGGGAYRSRSRSREGAPRDARDGSWRGGYASRDREGERDRDRDRDRDRGGWERSERDGRGGGSSSRGGYGSRDRERGGGSAGWDRDRERDRDRDGRGGGGSSRAGYGSRGEYAAREPERRPFRSRSRERSRERSRDRSRDRGGGGGRDARDVFRDRAGGGAAGGTAVRERYAASERMELDRDGGGDGRRSAAEVFRLGGSGRR